MFDAKAVKNLVLNGRLSYKQAVYLYERYLILKIMKKFRGNKAKAARFLNIHVNTIRYKLGKYAEAYKNL